MRKFSTAVLMVLGLVVGATLLTRPAASVLVPADEFHQTSLAIDQLTTNVKNLPVESFDAY